MHLMGGLVAASAPVVLPRQRSGLVIDRSRLTHVVERFNPSAGSQAEIKDSKAGGSLRRHCSRVACTYVYMHT